MLEEVVQSAIFLAHFLRDKRGGPSTETVNMFCQELAFRLFQRVHKIWRLNDPLKGSGYRAITCYSTLDPILVETALYVNIDVGTLSRFLPRNLTLFTDPGSSSFRINEGPVCMYYQTPL